MDVLLKALWELAFPKVFKSFFFFPYILGQKIVSSKSQKEPEKSFFCINRVFSRGQKAA